MPRTPAVLHPDPDKAHYVAQGVLCALASLSVLGVVVAWWQGGSGPTSPSAVDAAPQMPALVLTPPVATISPPMVAPGALPSTPAPASMPMPTPVATLPVTLPPPTAPPPALATVPAQLLGPPPGDREASSRPSLPVDKQLKNPQVIEAVNTAREVRRLGDMQAALESLRTADLREPKHPEILAEMALTYEAMGINSKAGALWREILGMGEAGAGGYHALAASKVTGSEPTPAAPAASPVSLGPCQAIRDPSAKEGERIAVRVPIIATPGATIDPTLMDIHVFLFETVNNGERIEQVRATAPTLNWTSAPVNWKDSKEEIVDVVYDLPRPKPEEVRDLGRRSFHGYIVKLFYQNKLAGEQAQPESVRDTAQKRSAPAGLDNALFPK